MLLAPTAGGAQLATLPDSLRFPLRSSDGTSARLSFLITDPRGNAAGDNLLVRVLVAPDGSMLDPSLVTVATTGAGTGHRRVELKLPLAHFEHPGEYRALLFFPQGVNARDGSGGVAKTLVVVRDTALLDLSQLKDRVVPLRRPYPWGSAAGDFRAPVENHGRLDLSLRVTAAPIARKGTRVLAGGRVTVADTAPLRVAAGRDAPLHLRLTDFGSAGEFDAGLAITSPSLQRVERVPLVVQVSDEPLVPLVVIALGVGLAYLVRYLAGSWLSGEGTRLRLVRARGELATWRARTTAPARQAAVAEMERLFREATDSDATGDAEGAKQRLDDFFKQRDALNAEERRIRAEATEKLHRVRLRGSEAQERLRRLDEATRTTLPAGVTALPDRISAEMKALDASLATVGADKLALDVEGIEAKVQQLEEELAKVASGAGGESASAARYGRMRRGTAGASASPGGQAVKRHPEVVARNPRPRAEEALEFAVEDPDGVLADGDTFDWSFDDDTVMVSGPERRATHTYQEPGEYVVRVVVRRGGQPLPELSSLFEAVTVRPTRSDEEAGRTRARVRAASWVLAGISIAIASFTGLWLLYIGKVFGSPEQYAGALLWGFGIDNGVRGVADVLKKVQGAA